MFIWYILTCLLAFILEAADIVKPLHTLSSFRVVPNSHKCRKLLCAGRITGWFSACEMMRYPHSRHRYLIMSVIIFFTKKYSKYYRIALHKIKALTSSGRPISIFSYRPIPITTDISDFHIGRYRCRYRYDNCIIGRYRFNTDT